MSERPFMQFYPSDFIGDTMHLTPEQMGAYIRLLCSMWNAHGNLPDDDRKLATISGFSMKKWRAVGDDIRAFFVLENGILKHTRMTKELQKVDRKSDSRRSAGAKGGAVNALKYNKQGVAKACDLLKHLPETINHKEERKNSSSSSFQEFWEEWESGGGAGLSTQAEQSWDDLTEDDKALATKHARAFVTDWKANAKEDTHPIHGKTYLSGKRWKTMPGRLKPAGVVISVREDPEAWAAWLEYFKDTGQSYSVQQMRLMKQNGSGTWQVQTPLPVYQECVKT